MSKSEVEAGGDSEFFPQYNIVGAGSLESDSDTLPTKCLPAKILSHSIYSVHLTNTLYICQ